MIKRLRWKYIILIVEHLQPFVTEAFSDATAKEDICHNVTGYRAEVLELSCTWSNTVSDRKKYVWAAISRCVPNIDVFDIDTGAIVGPFKTCMSPRDLEYHPLRNEIWARCQSVDPDNDFGEYMEVFAADAPTADIVSIIELTGNNVITSYGFSVIDKSLGDIGYTTVFVVFIISTKSKVPAQESERS